MIIRSTIRMIPAAKITGGKCGCCGQKAMLKFNDEHGGVKLGECCVSNMISAERFLHCLKKESCG